MLNMYFSVLNCSSGFPEVAAIKLIPFRVLGNIETAVNQCIDEFDKWSASYSGSAPFHVHRQELIEMAAMIESPDDVKSLGVNFRQDGRLIQRILSVSVRSGDDLPTRRY